MSTIDRNHWETTIMASVLILAGMLALSAAPAPTTCTLHAEQHKRNGSCGALVEGEATRVSVAPAPSIVTGTWRRDRKPEAVWAGTIVAGEYPATPVEIEVYADHTGVMRTLFGWYPVSHLASNADELSFDVDAAHEAAPSGIDREIVRRASAILASDAAWNRADNRKCPAVATTWSIYCAMEKATIEVSGAFHHRRPALQVVREIVDERTAGRPYDHRLMDYNNDPTTHLADVRSLFAEALKRIDAGTHGSRQAAADASGSG
jgi:hypothetical protein